MDPRQHGCSPRGEDRVGVQVPDLVEGDRKSPVHYEITDLPPLVVAKVVAHEEVNHVAGRNTNYRDGSPDTGVRKR